MSHSLIQQCRYEALEQFQHTVQHLNIRDAQANRAAEGTQRGIALVEALFDALEQASSVAEQSDQATLEHALAAAEQLAEQHPLEANDRWCQAVLHRAIWVIRSKLPEVQQQLARTRQQVEYAVRDEDNRERNRREERQELIDHWMVESLDPENLRSKTLYQRNYQLVAEQVGGEDEMQRVSEARKRQAEQRRRRASRRKAMFDPNIKLALLDKWKASVGEKYHSDAAHYAQTDWYEARRNLLDGISSAEYLFERLDPRGNLGDVIDSGVETARQSLKDSQENPYCDGWFCSVIKSTLEFFEHQQTLYVQACEAGRRELELEEA